MYEIKIPGKLYLIGEYNILNDGQSAILFTIDKYIKVKITHNPSFVLVNEKQTYPINVNQGIISVEEESLKISESAMQIALNYLSYLNISLKPFRLQITNQLVNKNGIKYGFGSSAAILIAIIKSILTFHHIEFSNLELFKIAVLGQHLLGRKTSGGDLAACVYGGVICYRRYNYQWLKNNLSRGFDIIKEEWPLLRIEELPYEDLALMIGWTNSAHSTDANLGKILNQQDVFLQFVSQANPLVIQARDAIVKRQFQTLAQLINRYQDQLFQLDHDLDLGFNTDILKSLIQVGNDCGGASKISGAGYGDCGISLNPNVTKLTRRWKKVGISPLKFHICPPLKENEYVRKT